MDRMRRKGWSAEIIAVVAAAVILIVLLLVKPVIGMADNGDFLRIMGTVGLQYADPGMSYEDKYFGYFIREYAFNTPGLGGYVSSSLIPVALSVLAGRLLFWGGTFDIRLLAVLYGGLLLWAIWLLIRANKGIYRWVNGVFAFLAVWMFADVGYTAYFNSFFSEPVSLLGMLMTFGFAAALLRHRKAAGEGRPRTSEASVTGSESQPGASEADEDQAVSAGTTGDQKASLTGGVRRRRSSWPRSSTLLLTGFTVSAVMLIGAKVQNAPIGLLLALLCWRFGSLYAADIRWRRRTRWSALVLAAAAVGIYFSVPKEIKVINEYQTVFYGVLKDSPDPARDLRELGLPEKFAVNAGTNYFEPAPIDQHDPMFARDYHPYFSHVKVALFYLEHPKRFYHKLERAADNGLTIRPYYLGSYEKAEGKPRGAIAYTFSGWSEFKHQILPNKLWFIALIYLLYFGVLIQAYLEALRGRRRAMATAAQVQTEQAEQKEIQAAAASEGIPLAEMKALALAVSTGPAKAGSAGRYTARLLYLEMLAAVGLIGLFQLIVPIIGDGEADLAKHLFGFDVSFDLMLLTLMVGACTVLARVLGRPRGRKHQLKKD